MKNLLTAGASIILYRLSGGKYENRIIGELREAARKRAEERRRASQELQDALDAEHLKRYGWTSKTSASEKRRLRRRQPFLLPQKDGSVR